MLRVPLRVKVACFVGHSIKDGHSLCRLQKHEHYVESHEEITERAQEFPMQSSVVRASQEILLTIHGIEAERHEEQLVDEDGPLPAKQMPHLRPEHVEWKVRMKHGIDVARVV